MLIFPFFLSVCDSGEDLAVIGGAGLKTTRQGGRRKPKGNLNGDGAFMADQLIIKRLATAISEAKRAGAFYSSGRLDASQAQLAIAGVGRVKLPVRPAGARKLIEAASQAPYGKGTKTLVDKSVRDGMEIPAEAVELSDSFQGTVERAADKIAEELGLAREHLRIELYKLLLYQKGGFFLPHRDSEKRRGMVATLVVVLPSKFGGGELVVTHEGRREIFTFGSARAEQDADYVAFFADCEHEVQKVRSGVRVCLTYNLILRPEGKPTAASKSDGDPQLLQAIGEWLKESGESPTVFALEHQYTASGLAPDLLKGADREIYFQLVAAAERFQCRLHFGQVSRHLCQFADDGSFGYGYRRDRIRSGSVDYDDLEVGEIYEDDIAVDGWKDARGKRVSLGALACDASMLISATPVDDWKPTKQDYEGYTGNAGNTLDRWYHKSAIVLWPDKHHFDVVATTGLDHAVETLLAMRAKLPTTPDHKLEQSCNDCEALAKAIIRHWPNRIYAFHRNERDDLPWLSDFADELPNFDEPELVGSFLQILAQRDWTLKLNKFVLASCKRMGAETISPHLLEFIRAEPQPNAYGRRPAEGLSKRDAAWIAQLCQEHGRVGMSMEVLEELLASGIQRFSQDAEKAEQERYRRGTDLDQTWLLLCKAALNAGDSGKAEKLFGMPATLPNVLDLRRFQVRASKELYAWAAKRFGEIPTAVTDWIASIRTELESATQIKPTPPNDFVRRSDTECDCRFCVQLQTFLADPNQETGKIAAREDRRDHLQSVIQTRQLDVKSQLDRSTRPYALQLTKTVASYERALQQYENDLRLLASLP